LLLDEHYSPEIATQLRKHGHDVVSVAERPDLVGLGDDELLARMASERRAIVTENAIDFVPLARQATTVGEQHYGVVLTSPRSMPRRKGTIGLFVQVIDAFLTNHSADDACRNDVRWLP
jgi:Domain of unknown function (DUF5615)